MCAKILFVGDPGTGKTTLAVAIAQALRDKIAYENKQRIQLNRQRAEQNSEPPLELLKFEYTLLDTPQLAGEVQNSGERNIKRAFSQIIEKSQGRCVIISDELDKLVAPLHAAKLSQDHDKGPAQALNTVLNSCLRQPNVVVIATTNDLESLPPALKSRFERNTFTLNMPNYDYRKDIIDYLFNKYRNRLNNSCLQPHAIERLARRTSRLSIRQIIEAIEEAVNSTKPFELASLEAVWHGLENPIEQGATQAVEASSLTVDAPSTETGVEHLATEQEIDNALQRSRPWWFTGYWNKVRGMPQNHPSLCSVAQTVCSQVALNIWNGVNIAIASKYSWWPGAILVGHEKMLNVSLLGLQLGHAIWTNRNQDKNQVVLDHSVRAAEWAEQDRDKSTTVLDHNVESAQWAKEDRDKQVEVLNHGVNAAEWAQEDREKNKTVLDHSVQSAQWSQEDRSEQKKILAAQAGDIQDSIQRQKDQADLSQKSYELSHNHTKAQALFQFHDQGVKAEMAKCNVYREAIAPLWALLRKKEGLLTGEDVENARKELAEQGIKFEDDKWHAYLRLYKELSPFAS